MVRYNQNVSVETIIRSTCSCVRYLCSVLLLGLRGGKPDEGGGGR